MIGGFLNPGNGIVQECSDDGGANGFIRIIVALVFRMVTGLCTFFIEEIIDRETFVLNDGEDQAKAGIPVPS